MDQTEDAQPIREILERAQATRSCLVGTANHEQQVVALVAQLEVVRLRKSMFFWPVSGRMAEIFVFGFSAAAHALGLESENRTWLKAGEKRGWKIQAVGPIPEMEERGLSDEEMADEVLAIAIEAWRLWLSENTNQTP